jgi:riboflavin kinase/FMN adenylyltransferase
MNSKIDDLIKYGKEYGFEVEQISVQEINDISVSSTKIKCFIFDCRRYGSNYLGYDYFLGKYYEGKQLGRTIDFPTANLEIKKTIN